MVVEPPDSRGLRQVRVSEEVVGAAGSLQELRKILIHEGFPEDMDLNDLALISWRGGGSDSWPERTRHRHLTAAVMTAGLIGSAIFLIVVGSEDAFGALTFASRVTGFVLFLAGLAQVLGAFAVKDYWGKRTVKYSGLLVLVGVFIALLIHTMFVVIWFQRMEFTPWALTYMPLAVWSLGATWIVVRERAWRGIPHPKQVTVGVLATTLLAGANFAYSAAYQPYAAQAQIDFTAKFGKPKLDHKEPVIHVPVTFSLQNTGKVPVHVIASVFRVQGRTSTFAAGEKEVEGERTLKGKREDTEWNRASELYAGPPKWDVIMTGLIIDPRNWFDPGTGQVEEVVVQVPKGAAYENLKVDGSVTVLRKDRGKIDTDALRNPLHSWLNGATDVFDCPRNSCGDHVLYMAELTHNNNVINVTRRQRYVVAVRYLDQAEMHGFVSPLNSQGKVSNNPEPNETYGMATYLTGTTVIPFATVLDAATH